MATQKSEKKVTREEKSTKGKKEPEKTEVAEKPVKPAKSKEPLAPAKKKLCRIISYEKMTPEIKALFVARYPEGYADFVTRYPKPSGESFYAVSLYSDEADYLIKVDVDVDMTLDEDYEAGVLSAEDEVSNEPLEGDQGRPDVNDLADTLADEASDSDPV